jgi:hypothetical protein
MPLQEGEGAVDVDRTLAELRSEHAALEARLQEIERHVSLTSEEQLEVVQLKKQKLLTKDRLASLAKQQRRNASP